ncbi:DNA polymerase IV [Sulfuricurvum sp.]|uniref:Y-family DNA polymerase n=1 Tax=Sulfuricurvum sp. TaxID=2025608 RepID=UPI002E33B918|nr:DNA polymerase IV [Sulfuricurvum sp.]HEX5329897.1 DNA polymerase IV [Sulfuricurvum sp.]
MIIHLDLDCFFASCERVLNPSLEGKCVAVGGRGDPFIFDKKPIADKKLMNINSGAFVPSLFHARYDSRDYFKDGDTLRGIITTASYEARAYGVKTAMSVHEALRLCPHLILLPPNHLLYHTMSHELMEYISSVVPVMEQYSIDEMFGDLSGWIAPEDTYDFIRDLQHQITMQFKLPVSIGASSSKWIAKLATSAAKPYGVRLVKENEIESFVKDIPIGEFPGVGKSFSAKMARYGIKTIGDAWRSQSLIQSWGRAGTDLYQRFRGQDHEPVQSKRSRKGIGMSRSMDHPIESRDELYRRIHILVRHWSHTIMKLGVNPTTYAFSLGYENGLSSKKQYTLYRLFNEQFLQHFSIEKFRELDLYPHSSVRYIGMSANKFTRHDPKSFDLLEIDNDTKMRHLTDALTQVRDKYGLDIIRGGGEL